MSGFGNLLPFGEPDGKKKQLPASRQSPASEFERAAGKGYAKILLVYPDTLYTREYSAQIRQMQSKIGAFEILTADNFKDALAIMAGERHAYNLIITYKDIRESFFSELPDESKPGFGRQLVEIALWHNPCARAIVELDRCYELHGVEKRALIMGKDLAGNPVGQFQHLVLAALSSQDKRPPSLEHLLLNYFE